MFSESGSADLNSGWLHIGNIAGNGFEAARLQRGLNLESDVVNPDLRHVMSHPIWEDVYIDREIDLNNPEELLNHNPSWQIPDYYFDGSLYESLKKLANARNIPIENKIRLLDWFPIAWRRFGQKAIRFLRAISRKFIHSKKYISSETRISSAKVSELEYKKQIPATELLIKLNALEKLWMRITPVIYRLLLFFYQIPIFFYGNILRMLRLEKYPELPRKLRYLVPALEILNKIAPNYQGLVLYGPWAALGAWSPNYRYIAVEHGTLRNYIFTKEPFAQACRLGFKNAEKVIVTNADCYEISLAENHKESIAGIHPFDNNRLKPYAQNRESFLKAMPLPAINIILASRIQLSTSVDAKGSELALEAIVELHRQHPELIFTIFSFGGDFKKIQKHLMDLGLGKSLIISPPLSRPALLKLFESALCVFDGFSLSGSGRIQIEAWGIGVPVLSKQDERLNRYFFTDTMPTFSASSADEIVQIVENIYNWDNSKMRKFQSTSINWFHRNHSSKRFLEYLSFE
jgi:hypothetical protein